MTLHTLLADIGGTNTRVARAYDGVLDESSIQRFRNANYAGLDVVLEAYLGTQAPLTFDGVCVDIAGPVAKGQGTLTNLDWTLQEPLLAEWTGAPVARVINDLQAQGYGVASLPDSALRSIVSIEDHQPETNTRLVVNVGTGFNAAVVIDTGTETFVPASESGHANLPIRTENELRLCKFLENIHGFPAVEDVLSGRGLERVYHWLTDEAGQPDQKHAADIMALSEDENAPFIADTLAIYTRIFGTVSGNLSLIHLPFGGVYLVGGVACALAPHLHRFGFVEAFRDKGRFSGLMGNFPVHVIEDDYAALRGAAHYLNAQLLSD